MSIRDEAYQGKPLSPFIIDAHTHLCPYFKAGWHQKSDMTSVESMLAVYDTLGVNCFVTAPHLLIDSMTIEANKVAQEAARRWPGRIYGYISIAVFEGMEAVKENIRLFSKDPAFVGFKFLGGYNGDLTEAEYRYATDFANEVGCPILCHTWADHPALSTLRDMAEKHPNLNIITAHLGGGSKAMTEKAAEIVRQVPNFHLEICGNLWNELGIEDVVEMIGADRVIFGTDAINLDARYDFGRVAFAPLSDEDKKKIFSGNYLRLLEHSQMGHIQVTA